MVYRAGIITLSDKGAIGEREDKSGEVIKNKLFNLETSEGKKDSGIEIEEYIIIPDEKDTLIEKLYFLVDEKSLDLVVTTGGTGLGPRDITPDATLEVIDKEVPGFSEVMRYESIKKTPHGMLSRAVTGIRKKTLIINLPGSPKAVEECLDAIVPALLHALEVLRGEASECADESSN